MIIEIFVTYSVNHDFKDSGLYTNAVDGQLPDNSPEMGEML